VPEQPFLLCEKLPMRQRSRAETAVITHKIFSSESPWQRPRIEQRLKQHRH
jgi:hypothetical protein